MVLRRAGDLIWSSEAISPLWNLGLSPPWASLDLPSSLFRVSLRGRTAEKEEEQLTTHCRQHARPPSQGSRP